MNVERGHLAGLYLRAMGLAKGDPLAARAFLEGVGHRAKALIATTADGTWAADAAAPAAVSDFLESVRPYSALERLPVRRVPFRTRLLDTDGSISAAIVAEGAPTPIKFGSVEGYALTEPVKALAEIIITRELAQAMTPDAERGLADDLAAAVARTQDGQFLDDIANGQPSVAATGSSLAQIDADLKAAIDLFEGDLRRAWWVVSPESATYLSLLRGTGGALAFPDIGVNGGTLAGVPVITSEGATQVDSPSNNSLFLIDPTRVAAADGGTELARSGNATIQVSGSPTNPPTASTVQVSLWQHNLLAMRATRWAAWYSAPGSVVAITGASY